LALSLCLSHGLCGAGGIVYHVYFPYQNLIITLGLVCVVLAPLVLPVVLVYSLVGYFVFEHQVGGMRDRGAQHVVDC